MADGLRLYILQRVAMILKMKLPKSCKIRNHLGVFSYFWPSNKVTWNFVSQESLSFPLISTLPLTNLGENTGLFPRDLR